MKQTLFQRLKAHDLVDWSTLQFGVLNNRPGAVMLVDSKDVSDYAMKEISSLPDDLVPICGELIGAESVDTDEVLKGLSILAQRFGQNSGVAMRKWRAVTLEALLEDLGAHPVYDLLKLGDFWSLWGGATSGPHVVQGVNNTIAPGDYYSESNLLASLSTHKQWLDAEILSLKQKAALPM